MKPSGGVQISSSTRGASPRDQLRPDAFSADELKQIRQAVRSRYAEVSKTAEGVFKYPTGRDGAIALNYDRTIIDLLPEELINSVCGVGNPFAIADIRKGSSVLDIGCGVGFDLVVAGRLVGSGGRVCGTDLTEEMIRRSKANIESLGLSNVETVHVSSDDIPFEDGSFDVIISNGVINLSPGKRELFREMYRVLKPGGAIQFADIVLEKDLPDGMAGSPATWAQ